jgi:Matrixin
MPRFRSVWVLCLALFASALPRTARAFCQTHTCEFSGTQMCTWDAAAGCYTGGAVAHWGTSCIDYAVQLDGSKQENIPATALAGLLKDGFQIWSDAVCGPGLSPELTASYRGLTSCTQVEFNCEAGPDNDHIVMFRDARSDLPPSTIALSTIIANTNTGEILDVDIEINSHDFDFYLNDSDVAPRDRASGGSDGAHDLRLVLNHEIGHFLGLSHSLEQGALMRAAYDGFDRNPARDDIAGICKSLKQSRTDPVCSVEPSPGECVGTDTSCPPGVQRVEQSGCSLGTVPSGNAPSGNAPSGSGRRGNGRSGTGSSALGAALFSLLFCARGGLTRRRIRRCPADKLPMHEPVR